MNNRFFYSQGQFLNCYLACFSNKNKIVYSDKGFMILSVLQYVFVVLFVE